MRPRLLLLLATSLALPVHAFAQSPSAPATPDGSPVGHWSSQHTAPNGVGSWWNFRPDGTLTVYIGPMVTSHFTRYGDTLTLPATTAGGAPVQFNARVQGSTLHLITPGGPDVTYTRVGPAAFPSDPLIGRWKPDPPKVPSTDPKRAALEKANANGLYVFGANNIEAVRIPFNVRQGTWDGAAHTYKLENSPAAYSFQLSAGKLTLTMPSATKVTETFQKDPILSDDH